jgi:hypothetical protein
VDSAFSAKTVDGSLPERALRPLLNENRGWSQRQKMVRLADLIEATNIATASTPATDCCTSNTAAALRGRVREGGNRNGSLVGFPSPVLRRKGGESRPSAWRAFALHVSVQ